MNFNNLLQLILILNRTIKYLKTSDG